MDSQYIRVITETGLLGLASFFFLMITLFMRSYSAFKESSETFDKGISMGFIAGFIGLLVHSIGANTFIIVRIMEPFWFMTAIVISFRELK